MNLIMIVSNDDSENKLLWKVLEDCDFFNNKLNNRPIILSQLFYKTIPIKKTNRRYIVVSKEITTVDSDVLIFQNNFKLLRRLELMTEDVYMICDKDMYNYFLPYAKKVYVIEYNQQKNKIIPSGKDFIRRNLIETNTLKMIEYRKEEYDVR